MGERLAGAVAPGLALVSLTIACTHMQVQAPLESVLAAVLVQGDRGASGVGEGEAHFEFALARKAQQGAGVSDTHEAREVLRALV